jgi:hypothetical protein
MFRQFANTIPSGALEMFKCHPAVLTTLLEVAWQSRAEDTTKNLGNPYNRSNLSALPDFAAQMSSPAGEDGFVLWDHLIYAYMIENTRIYELFQRVVHEFRHGEKLGVPSPETQLWLRNTEELFYREPPSFSITAVTSFIRPDMRAVRRNAYFRMFGMDLNHGAEDAKPYPHVKPEASNNEFVTTFEELLKEVWIAIANIRNSSGANPTDEGKIRNLVNQLQDMLVTRRISGNLSREEFVAVSTLSWFHLTVGFNESPVVKDLRAEAASPEQRLYKIAQRVGLPAHGLSQSFFEIAEVISRVLIQIESDGVGIVPALVATGTALNALQSDMNIIITHWSTITGRNVKARAVTAN